MASFYALILGAVVVYLFGLEKHHSRLRVVPKMVGPLVLKGDLFDLYVQAI